MSHFKSQYKIINLLRQQLCAPKDPIRKGDIVQGSIYHISCNGSTGVDCDSTYVGKTGGSLRNRIAEHLRQSSVEKSEVATHLHRDCQTYKITLDNVEVLDREQDWRKRGIREAIYIRVNKPDPNRDQGRFNLHHSRQPFVVTCVQI